MIAETAYLLANKLIPDEGPLALYNCFYELHEKLLEADDAAGAARADDDETHLAAVIGHSDLHGRQFSYHHAFAANLSEGALMRVAIDAIQALPSGTVEEEALDEDEIVGPTTTAVMAVWQKKDGSLWATLYRHPQFTPGLAAAVLKEVISDFKLDAEPPAEDGGSRN